MAKFRIKSEKKDNSNPKIKIALRKWAIEKHGDCKSVLDVYGGHGMMFDRIWKNYDYQCSQGDAIEYLQKQQKFNQDVFDIDPYSSPYEALEIICKKSTKSRIGVICTDGTLRRVCMMRTKIPEFLQLKCGWPGRDLSLMAGIYHQYPKFLRRVLSCICYNYQIERLAIQYGKGTWKQATVYFSVILQKKI